MARAGDGTPRSNQRRRNHIFVKRLSDAELANLTQAAHLAGFQTYKKFLSHLITEQAQAGAVQRRSWIEILSILNVIVSKLAHIETELKVQSQDAKAVLEGLPDITRDLTQASEMIYRQIPRE